jgi:hypothetical protein
MAQAHVWNMRMNHEHLLAFRTLLLKGMHVNEHYASATAFDVTATAYLFSVSGKS